jgi:hypothetical protein
MLSQKDPPIFAVFDNRGKAESAIDELWHAGFRQNQIGIAAPGERLHEADTATGPLERKGAQGAVTGAVTGGTLGAVLGALATAVIPGIGPVMAGGLLAGIVTGAAAGAAAGGFLGPFVALEMSSDQAHAYQQEFEQGRTIVAVRPNGRAEEVRTIFHSHGGSSAVRS